MQRALDTFDQSLARVRHLGGIYLALSSLTTNAIDASDLLRAQIVLAVSALDQYVHEITCLGMVEIMQGKRQKTAAFLKFPIPVNLFLSANTTSYAWFENEIRSRHSFLSFQQPDKVADAIRNFSEIRLWREVASLLNEPEEDIKGRLKLIVDRRNKIAHEADVDPSYPGARWPISEVDVMESVSYIEKICHAIHKLIIPTTLVP